MQLEKDQHSSFSSIIMFENYQKCLILYLSYFDKSKIFKVHNKSCNVVKWDFLSEFQTLWFNWNCEWKDQNDDVMWRDKGWNSILDQDTYEVSQDFQ